MIRKTLILLLLLCPFAAQSAYEASYHDERLWKKVSEKNGLKLFMRKEKGTKILGFKIAGILMSPVENILATLRDVELSTEWTPGLISKITLHETSDEEAITYSLNKMPWPASDRELVLHNKLFLSEEKKLLYLITKSMEHASRPITNKYIRAFIGYSYMGIRPLGAHKTYFEWTIFADPRGWIPAWMVNFFQKKFPIKFLQRLEKRSNEKVLVLKPGLKRLLLRLRVLMNKK